MLGLGGALEGRRWIQDARVQRFAASNPHAYLGRGRKILHTLRGSQPEGALKSIACDLDV